MTATVTLLALLAVATLALTPFHLCHRRRQRMFAEIRARVAALQSPVSRPSGDGSSTTGAGTPDPAPVVVPHRRRVVGPTGTGRHRAAGWSPAGSSVPGVAAGVRHARAV